MKSGPLVICTRLKSMTTSVQLAKNFKVSYVVIASVFSVQHLTASKATDANLFVFVYFVNFGAKCFVYFVNFGAKCFGLAFGGTFTRLEEGSELRRKYNRQEKFNAQLQE